MSLRARLFVPFRTALTIDLTAFEDLDALAHRLAVLPSTTTPARILPWRSGEYLSLDDDCVPAFLSPIATVAIAIPPEPPEQAIASAADTMLHLFFHNLAIVEQTVTIDPERLEPGWRASELERHLRSAMAARLSAPIDAYIAEATSALRRNGAVMPHHRSTPAATEPLWVNRTYVLPSIEVITPRIAALTRLDYIRERGDEAFDGVWVHPGTNIAQDERAALELQRPLLALQHAAALCAEIQSEQVRIARSIRMLDGRRTLAPMLDRVSRLGDLCMMVEIELAASAAGFQANRRCAAEALHRAYNIQASLEALKGRQSFVERSLDAQFKRGQARRARVGAQLLALLTAAQLVSVLADLYGAAGNLGTRPPEGHAGVLSLVRRIGFNDVFSLVALATIVVILLRYRRDPDS